MFFGGDYVFLALPKIHNQTGSYDGFLQGMNPGDVLVVDAVGQHRVVLGYVSARVHLGNLVMSLAGTLLLLVHSKFLVRVNRYIFLQIVLF